MLYYDKKYRYFANVGMKKLTEIEKESICHKAKIDFITDEIPRYANELYQYNKITKDQYFFVSDLNNATTIADYYYFNFYNPSNFDMNVLTNTILTFIEENYKEC